jgi:hypothetical protein
MDKASVKKLKKAWQAYDRNPTNDNLFEFVKQMELHHFSVFSCLELYSR